MLCKFASGKTPLPDINVIHKQIYKQEEKIALDYKIKVHQVDFKEDMDENTKKLKASLINYINMVANNLDIEPSSHELKEVLFTIKKDSLLKLFAEIMTKQDLLVQEKFWESCLKEPSSARQPSNKLSSYLGERFWSNDEGKKVKHKMLIKDEHLTSIELNLKQVQVTLYFQAMLSGGEEGKKMQANLHNPISAMSQNHLWERIEIAILTTPFTAEQKVSILAHCLESKTFGQLHSSKRVQAALAEAKKEVEPKIERRLSGNQNTLLYYDPKDKQRKDEKPSTKIPKDKIRGFDPHSKY
jgi:hypothetical protein